VRHGNAKAPNRRPTSEHVWVLRDAIVAAWHDFDSPLILAE
jgi:hypothetical protein